ncbi:hypothetical protein ACFLZX_04350 [Nanoarchaeota archaeon]
MMDSIALFGDQFVIKYEISEFDSLFENRSIVNKSKLEQKEKQNENMLWKY